MYDTNDNDDHIQWLEYMEGHERWWDAIWRAAAERGDEEVFILDRIMIVYIIFPIL